LRDWVNFYLITALFDGMKVVDMVGSEVISNVVLLVICYLYVAGTIVVTGKISQNLPKNFSRKFLHIMIGNLIFIIPFFSFNTFPLNFPFFVAAPFILLTLLVSPSSPIKNLSSKMTGLAGVTTGGHKFGLVLYAVSYTLLALFFSSKPHVIAAGIMPLAYGDAAAYLAGQKFGRHQYKVFAKKSAEGSIAMFGVCLLCMLGSALFFSYPYPLLLANLIVASFGVAAVATILEAITPLGLDNLTVPLFSATVFLFLLGGM
jgi:dolichol kinase